MKAVTVNVLRFSVQNDAESLVLPKNVLHCKRELVKPSELHRRSELILSNNYTIQ